MPIPVLSDIERWITEHGSAAVLKEHLALLQAKVTLLKEEIAKLEKENASLKAKVASFEATAAQHTEEYVEERGALFKRRSGGGYHSAVYCPRCRQSTAPFPSGEEFNCKCGWFSSFREPELPRILASQPP